MQIFNFQDNINRPVRTQIINNEPFWVLKDVCDILELKNITMVKSRLNQKGLSNNEVLTNGGMQQMIMINEGNLYKCVLQSRKKEAIEFENWITEKVLPTIRKTGKFEVQQTPLIDSKFLLQIAQQMAEKEELIERQKIVINHLENETKEQQSRIDKKDEENQKLKITINDFFKGAELFTRRQVCHFLARQGLAVKEQQITDFLNKKKWLCKGEHNTNKATAESCRIGWFVNDISVYEVNGRKKTREYGKFTVEGLVGIYNAFKK